MTETFCQRLVEAAEARPDKVAMVILGPDGSETTTFRSMIGQVRGLAYRLSQEQIEFGDRVAILGENHPHWAIAYLGIIYRGAVAVPLDPAATTEALAAFIDDSKTNLAFVSARSLEKYHAVCDRLGRRIPGVALLPPGQTCDLARYEDWARTPTPPEFDAARPPARSEDMAVLMYTSGTTGKPKAVPLTHGNILAESEAVGEALRLNESEIILSLLPLFHAYSQMVNLWFATTVGARIVYVTDLNGPDIERGLKQGAVTALVGVPRLFYLFHKRIMDGVREKPAPVRWILAAMMAVNGWLRDRLGLNAGRVLFRPVHQAFGGKLRLTISGGSSLDVQMARDFHRLGFTLLQGYGLTETSGAATVTRFEDNKLGSVGLPLNNVEIRIDSPNEEGDGEILIRGPIVTPGYYQNSMANREAFTADGWFRSGDLGRLDRQGRLYITGRKKDVIVLPSGKNVYPEDVEAHYEHSPFVKEICVLGVRDESVAPEGGEKLCAVVVPDFDYLRANRIANAREAIRFELDNLGRELPEHQRVRDYIIRTDPLPRTSTRKIRRFELQTQAQAAGAASLRAPDLREFELAAEDRALMNSDAGRVVVAAIRRQAADARTVHPRMNLELDLGLDSLARAECMASIENALGIELDSEEMVAAHTVGEIVTLAAEKSGGHAVSAPVRAPDIRARDGSRFETDGIRADWQEILTQASLDDPAVQHILKRKRGTAVIVYVLLRVVNAFARFLLRLDVSGLDVLKRMERPFLICPNHQSYVDPILICSTYPFNVLQHIFHVGASEYFTNFFAAWLAWLINIVPIDPDTNLLRALRAGAVGLRAGKVLNIYPEGQRSFDGLLHEFKKGAAILALELGVPIVPVALDGTYRVWPRGSSRIRLAKVKIRFGEPIRVGTERVGKTETAPSYEELTESLKKAIQQMLDEMRH